MKKFDEIDNLNSCFNKADIDEPLFVLRANDPLAPMVVRIWASLNGRLGAHHIDKSSAAYAAALKMEQWSVEKYGDPQIDWARP